MFAANIMDLLLSYLQQYQIAANGLTEKYEIVDLYLQNV
jgi:hypothetical protein